MPCSAVTLSLATVSAIIAVALLAIAFSTDNWLYIEVKRGKIEGIQVIIVWKDNSEFHLMNQVINEGNLPALSSPDLPKAVKCYLRFNVSVLLHQTNPCIFLKDIVDKRGNQESILDDMNNKYYYFTRTKGLFRICYPKEKPKSVHIYLSPVETHCSNIDYYIPDVDNLTKEFTDDATTRLHMGRSMIALFILSFLAVFIAFWTGIAGCWRRSPGNITATAIIMLFACLFSAGSMGLWHGVEYFEKEKVVGEEFYQQWDNALRDNTIISYDWSYFVAWVGVGFSLISAILFSGAAICLRGEREKEEAMNMQYLMPVYPQKQQYAYAGYPAPYYPGPQYAPGPGTYSY